MGFFDFCCPVSGLSLRAADAVHLGLIELSPERWAPLTLPIRGCYNRLGTIDGIGAELLAPFLVQGFSRLVAAGRVKAESVPDEIRQYLRFPDLKGLLSIFERVNTMSKWGPMPFTLDGHQIRQVLIHADIFDALAPAPPLAAPPDYEALERELAGSCLASQGREWIEEVIIGADPIRLQASIRITRLHRLDRWLKAAGRVWSPLTRQGQFFVSDDLIFAEEARESLAGYPELKPALEQIFRRLRQEERG